MPTWCRSCRRRSAGTATTAPICSRLMADPAPFKLMHFARFDVAMLQHALGITVAPVQCTKIAARLTRTFTDRHGLKDLCKELLGIDLSKQQQTSDWGAVELTSEQMAYAASDVLHLHALWAKLEAVLIREGRLELARGLFRIPADPGAARSARLRAAGHFRSLTIAATLTNWQRFPVSDPISWWLTRPRCRTSRKQGRMISRTPTAHDRRHSHQIDPRTARPSRPDEAPILQVARNVLRTEAAGLQALAAAWAAALRRAVDLLAARPAASWYRAWASRAMSAARSPPRWPPRARPRYSSIRPRRRTATWA